MLGLRDFVLFSVLFSHLVTHFDVYALLCRSCDLIQYPSECDVVETCNSSSAICGVTRVSTSQGYLYNLSCVEQEVCAYVKDGTGTAVTLLPMDSSATTSLINTSVTTASSKYPTDSSTHISTNFTTTVSQRQTTRQHPNITVNGTINKQTPDGIGLTIVCPPTVDCKNGRLINEDIEFSSDEVLSTQNKDNVVSDDDASSTDITGCCNKTFCNEFKPEDLTSTSVALQPSVNVSERGCRVCSGLHTHVLGCNNIETCQDTQVCYAAVRVYDQNKFGFVYGCEDTHKCVEFIKHMTPADLGKRAELGIPICSACCLGYLCNQEDCYDLKRNMTLESIGVTETQG